MKNDYLLSLANHFLIAMPHLNDSEFAQTLIYMVSHTPDGAMGLVVNKPQSIHLLEVLEQLKPDQLFPAEYLMTPIYCGGPVEPERGFVLHDKGLEFEGTVELEGLSITSSQDILVHIGETGMPTKKIIALGYASWGAGQLDRELLNNVWLTCQFEPSILFNVPYDQRLNLALSQLGVDLHALSSQVGHA